ncbi:hypothetical protein [Pseudoalteromonas mariniglutinosa]|uniref:hypothetical protein n=1 Tax=Pseudoalteromonas mariniglutinosa TaxID=206042 RepID=UPI00384A7A0B
MATEQQQICDFGLHNGEPYSKLPASFLNWMVGNKHEKSHYAEQELMRRQLAATGQLVTEDNNK